MKKYFLIRFTYDKECRKGTVNTYTQPTLTKLFVEASNLDSACKKILNKYPDARKFKDLTIR